MNIQFLHLRLFFFKMQAAVPVFRELCFTCFLVLAFGLGNLLTAQNEACNTENVQFSSPTPNPFGLESDNPGANTPASVYLLDVDNDGKDEAFVANLEFGPDGYTETRFFENDGTTLPNFTLDSVYLNTLPFGWPGIPNVDIDGDCDLDIIRSWFFAEDGGVNHIRNVVFYENQAEAEGHFDFSDSEAQVNPWGIVLPPSPDDGTVMALIWPSFGDIDDDGDMDMFTGGGWFNQTPDEQYVFFENTGTPENPIFDSHEFDPFGLKLPIQAGHNSTMVDIDCDGDLDLFTQIYGFGALFFHENIGTPQSPDFSCQAVEWSDMNFNVTFGTFKDINDDGRLDAITGGNNVRFYENITEGLACEFETACFIVNTRDIRLDANLSLYPNPASGYLTLDLDSNEPLDEVAIEIFDLLGQKVKRLSRQSFGNALQEEIRLAGLPEGIYTLRVSSEGKFIAKKFVKMN